AARVTSCPATAFGWSRGGPIHPGRPASDGGAARQDGRGVPGRAIPGSRCSCPESRDRETCASVACGTPSTTAGEDLQGLLPPLHLERLEPATVEAAPSAPL